MSNQYGVYGFRFLDTLDQPFYKLYALGCQKVTEHTYNWDGLKRVDGPVLLFQYTLSGFGHIEINGKTHKLGPGKAFMVEIPGAHRYFLPKSSQSWEFYFVQFRPDFIQREWREIVRRFGPVVEVPKESSPILFLQQMFHAAARKQITDGYRASSIVYQFIMELYRLKSANKKEKAAWPEKIQQAAHHMEEQYVTLQSLEEIAESVGLSKYHFTRSFKNTTGLTPIEFLTKVRMEKAVALLRSTSLTVEEVAKEIGYSNGSYFIKVFRQWTGFCPGEFRNGEEMVSFSQMTFD
jgi:AraC-like DNA-binding protein